SQSQKGIVRAYIADPVRSKSDSVERDQLYDSADHASLTVNWSVKFDSPHVPVPVNFAIKRCEVVDVDYNELDTRHLSNEVEAFLWVEVSDAPANTRARLEQTKYYDYGLNQWVDDDDPPIDTRSISGYTSWIVSLDQIRMDKVEIRLTV